SEFSAWCLFAVRAYLRHNSPTRHLNRRLDGIFEIVRVVGRGLVSIAKVHAIVAGAHHAQSEPEMARDRFGLLERHGFVKSSSGSVSTATNCTNCTRCLWRGPVG